MEKKYYRTLYASYLGYVTQAIVNNFAPLLFVIFQKEYHISVAQIGFLVTFNFGAQMLVDLLSAKYVDKLGYRRCILAAHIFSVIGLAGLGIFPDILGNHYAGLLLAITFYAMGSGLIEVLVSPIVESLPMDEKSSAMSLLHSFYCWGHVAVVILSTIFFTAAGIHQWRILAFLWALIPFVNLFIFAGAPLDSLVEKGRGLSVRALFGKRVFWLFVVLMLAAGASEQAMSQWASYFSESGLGVSKTLGDLLGPCMFAVLMGISRSLYGFKGDKIPLEKFMIYSGALCVASYLLTVFAPHPVLSLAGCALCGFSVGIMWPGTFSLAARHCPEGGTAMFAVLALGGDIGCAGGPFVVGAVSGLFDGGLKGGLLVAALFPAVLFALVSVLKGKKTAGEKAV